MILIAGDSWSVGEYQPDGTVLHNGLSQYLYENSYPVVNVGRGSASNVLAIELLRHFLTANAYLAKDVSHVFFFQTEWTRDLDFLSANRYERYLKQGYQHLKNTMLASIYKDLNVLAETYKIKIFVLGGCSDVQCWTDNTLYPNLTIACASLTALLTGGDQTKYEPVYTTYLRWQDEECVSFIKKRINSSELPILLQDVDLSFKRRAEWRKNPEHFWPDGVHPNRHGHRVIFDFLQSQGII